MELLIEMYESHWERRCFGRESLKSNKKLIRDDDPRNIIAEYVLACTTGAFGEREQSHNIVAPRIDEQN